MDLTKKPLVLDQHTTPEGWIFLQLCEPNGVPVWYKLEASIGYELRLRPMEQHYMDIILEDY